MKLHWSSFLFGSLLGAVLVSRRLRPLLLEIATAGYRVADSVAARMAMRREDLEDLLAEARARVRRTSNGQRARGRA
jgi:hypothetical protein